MRTPVYWSGNTFVKNFTESVAPNQTLVTSSVVRGDGLAGASSLAGKTGVFIPTATLAGWLVSGSGLVLSEGPVLSEGFVRAEN